MSDMRTPSPATGAASDSASLDAMDERLDAAFARALTALDGNDALVNQVITAVRRRQRRRTVVLMTAILAAALICVINGLPLVATAAESLASLDRHTWAGQLPTILTGAVVLFGCTAFFQMLIEDDV